MRHKVRWISREKGREVEHALILETSIERDDLVNYIMRTKGLMLLRVDNLR